MQAAQHPLLPSSNGHGPEKPVSYERYMVDTAIELVREIARHLDTLAAQDGAEKNLKFDANKAWSSLDNLTRIEVK